jgi:hypothetical protein
MNRIDQGKVTAVEIPDGNKFDGWQFSDFPGARPFYRAAARRRRTRSHPSAFRRRYFPPLPGTATGAGRGDVAQTSKPAVSQVSKPARLTMSRAGPTGKSAAQQVGQPALRRALPGPDAAPSKCAHPPRHESFQVDASESGRYVIYTSLLSVSMAGRGAVSSDSAPAFFHNSATTGNSRYFYCCDFEIKELL